MCKGTAESEVLSGAVPRAHKTFDGAAPSFMRVSIWVSVPENALPPNGTSIASLVASTLRVASVASED